MIEVETLGDLQAYLGQEIGVSDWIVIDQPMIDAFANLTGDYQWIHTDVVRAQAEMADGKTIAHGWLLLSMLPRLSKDFYRVRRLARSVNYGSNKIRFISPVRSGESIRLRQSLIVFEPLDNGVRLAFNSVIEIEGNERPAVVAETLRISYPPMD